MALHYIESPTMEHQPLRLSFRRTKASSFRKPNPEAAKCTPALQRDVSVFSCSHQPQAFSRASNIHRPNADSILLLLLYSLTTKHDAKTPASRAINVTGFSFRGLGFQLRPAGLRRTAWHDAAETPSRVRFGLGSHPNSKRCFNFSLARLRWFIPSAITIETNEPHIPILTYL